MNLSNMRVMHKIFLTMNFMLPVPDASVPAREICRNKVIVKRTDTFFECLTKDHL